ncbi:hypothetical protein M5689_002105 [Euphorbia peplus]|nr:hypothetical protein M5689_002105 [Euphorbia peplus]
MKQLPDLRWDFSLKAVVFQGNNSEKTEISYVRRYMTCQTSRFQVENVHPPKMFLAAPDSSPLTMIKRTIPGS